MKKKIARKSENRDNCWNNKNRHWDRRNGTKCCINWHWILHQKPFHFYIHMRTYMQHNDAYLLTDCAAIVSTRNECKCFSPCFDYWTKTKTFRQSLLESAHSNASTLQTVMCDRYCIRLTVIMIFEIIRSKKISPLQFESSQTISKTTYLAMHFCWHPYLMTTNCIWCDGIIEKFNVLIMMQKIGLLPN